MDRHQQLLLLSFAILAVPSIIFMVNSRGIGWDTIGHVAEAQVYKQDVLPSVYGWNSYFLFGYPIHVYPPLSRFALAALMEAFDWATAVNLLLVLSCMAVIPSVYLFLVNFGYDKEKAAMAVLLVSFYMASIGMEMEFTLANAYKIGQIGYTLALPFFFLSLAYFNKNLKVSAFCAAAVILSNLVSAIMLAICLAILALMRLHDNRSLREIGRHLLFGAIVFALTLFWLAPYVQHTIFYGNKDVWYGSPSIPGFAGMLMIGAIWYFVYFKKLETRSELSFLVNFAVIALMHWLMPRQFGIDEFKIPFYIVASAAIAYLISRKDRFLVKFYLAFAFIFFAIITFFPILATVKPVFGFAIVHAYRYQTLIDLLGVVAMAFALHDYAKRLKKTDWLVAGVAVLFIASYLTPYSYFFRGYLHPDESGMVYDFSAISTIGRVLVYDGRGAPNPHASYFEFFLQKGTPIAHGLFIEEASLSDLSLTYSQMTMRVKTFLWGAMPIPPMNMFFEHYGKAAPFYADMFYVTDVLVPPAIYRFESDSTPYYLEKNFQVMGDLNSSGVVFRHYRIGNFSVADIRPVEPACASSWKKLMYAWFDTNQTQIYYDSCKTVQYDRAAAEKASVEVLNYSNGKIDLAVHSDSAVPVFVKEAYDPDWKAYSNGGSLAVYRVTPAFMEVFGKGRISLRYEPDANLHLFALLGAGLLFVAFAPRERVESWFLEKGKGKR